MNISIRQMRAFLSVAQCRSFAEASELLHMTQPALSVAIRNLEEAVGGRLFARTTRSVELTPEGRGFYPVARRLLSDWDQALDDLSRRFSLKQGKVSVAVMPSFAMNQFPGALVAFQQSNPDINLTIEDVVMESVIDAVRSGHADLGITFEPDQLDGVDFIPLFRDRFVALLPPGSPLAARRQLEWRALAAQRFIAMNRGSWSRATTDQAMAEAGVQPRHLLEANQLATIGRMVSVGLGVAAVPQLCQQHMESMGVICRPINRPRIERQVGLFTRRRHPLSQAASVLCEHLQAYFRDGI